LPGGKKRVSPQLLQGPNNGTDGDPIQIETSTEPPSYPNTVVSNPPMEIEPKGTLPPKKQSQKRKRDKSDDIPHKETAQKKRKIEQATDKTKKDVVVDKTIEKNPVPQKEKPARPVKTPALLIPAKTNPVLAFEISVDDFGTRTMLECTNQNGTCVIQCTQGTTPTTLLWKDKLRAEASAVTGTDKFAAVGLVNGDLLIYTQMGRRIFPCLKLGVSPVWHLSSCNAFLMAILCQGIIIAWNIETQTKLFSTNLDGILKRNDSKSSILNADIDENGCILVATQTAEGGISHTFNRSMNTWIKVFDNSFAYSEHASSLDLWKKKKGPLLRAKMLAQVGDVQKRAIDLMELEAYLDPNLQSDIETETTSHLEHQIVASLALISPSEYKQWLSIYVQKLISIACDSKLSELCSTLITTIDQPVLGFSKRALLLECVVPFLQNQSEMKDTVLQLRTIGLIE